MPLKTLKLMLPTLPKPMPPTLYTLRRKNNKTVSTRRMFLILYAITVIRRAIILNIVPNQKTS